MPLTVETDSTETVTPIITQESDEEQQDLSKNSEEGNNETLLPASLPTIPEDKEDDIAASPPPEEDVSPSPSPSSAATDDRATVVEISEDELVSNTSQPLSASTLSKIHHDPTKLPLQHHVNIVLSLIVSNYIVSSDIVGSKIKSISPMLQMQNYYILVPYPLLSAPLLPLQTHHMAKLLRSIADTLIKFIWI